MHDTHSTHQCLAQQCWCWISVQHSSDHDVKLTACLPRASGRTVVWQSAREHAEHCQCPLPRVRYGTLQCSCWGSVRPALVRS
eukprot:9571456-Alexandrium_andersonii.AAC.1